MIISINYCMKDHLLFASYHSLYMCFMALRTLQENTQMVQGWQDSQQVLSVNKLVLLI